MSAFEFISAICVKLFLFLILVGVLSCAQLTQVIIMHSITLFLLENLIFSVEVHFRITDISRMIIGKTGPQGYEFHYTESHGNMVDTINYNKNQIWFFPTVLFFLYFIHVNLFFPSHM
jgi:hypothetical protein